MKKALALLSALAFASAAQSDGFLANNELRIRPISYNPTEDFSLEDFPRVFPKNFPRDLPPLVYVDDEQYANFNLGQNWHYPLPPLPMMTPAEIQAHIEEDEDSVENALFDLGEILQKSHEVAQTKQEVRQIRVGPSYSGPRQNDANDVTPIIPNHEIQHH